MLRRILTISVPLQTNRNRQDWTWCRTTATQNDSCKWHSEGMACETYYKIGVRSNWPNEILNGVSQFMQSNHHVISQFALWSADSLVVVNLICITGLKIEIARPRRLTRWAGPWSQYVVLCPSTCSTNSEDHLELRISLKCCLCLLCMWSQA